MSDLHENSDCERTDGNMVFARQRTPCPSDRDSSSWRYASAISAVAFLSSEFARRCIWGIRIAIQLPVGNRGFEHHDRDKIASPATLDAPS